jgi:hypothetical protein
MTLEVEFKNGAIYQYFDVPESAHVELMTAPSIGKYINEQIKNSYRYAQI